MSRRLVASALLASVLLYVLVQSAAAAPVLVDQRLQQPTRLTVGDRFHLVVTVATERGSSVSFIPASLPPQLVLASRPTATTRTRDDVVEVTLDLELAAFVPGDMTMPAMRIAYVEAGGATGEISTRPFALSVASVLPQSGDLVSRDLKPQLAISEAGAGTPVVLVAALAVLVAAVAALGFWYTHRARRRAVEAPLPAPAYVEEGPEDRARAVLDRAGADFGATGDYVAYYSAIAVTVRNYLSERFGFPAFALTTSELQAQMVGRGIDRWQARVVSGLLSQCDAVVFAGYRPALERADADLTAAYEVVEMARPLPVTEQVEVAAP